MKYLLTTIKQSFIYLRLAEIRNKPGLWLKKKSLNYLDCYVGGYIEGYCDHNVDENIAWFIEFKKYICKVCVAGNETYGPVNAIFACGYDDESGFDYYYELLDSFIREKGLGKEYEENNKEEINKDESYLKNEIKVLEVNEKTVYEMANSYISEHEAELFDLPENSMGKYRRYSLFEDKKITTAVYDPRYVDLNEVKHKINVESTRMKSKE